MELLEFRGCLLVILEVWGVELIEFILLVVEVEIVGVWFLVVGVLLVELLFEFLFVELVCCRLLCSEWVIEGNLGG